MLSEEFLNISELIGVSDDFKEQKKAVLVLDDGMTFFGRSIGYDDVSVGEVVFNTAMTGYQEIITDPSYCNQLVTLTYPHIGNVGCNETDMESIKPHLSGLIIKQISETFSNHRGMESLQCFLKRNKIVGIDKIDTRKLTLHLRGRGSQNGAIISSFLKNDSDLEKAKREARSALDSFEGISGKNVAEKVSGFALPEDDNWISSSKKSQPKKPLKVVVMDLGVKKNIIINLKRLGFLVTVVPSNSTFTVIKELNPDGLVISNGPGDPEPCENAIEVAKLAIEENLPTLGICLGHQIIGLALGLGIKKMTVGHHGANHPVENLKNGNIFITSQNHGFVVDQEGLNSKVEITHSSLFDGTIQGFKLKNSNIFAFQGHPEGCPGPTDISEVFSDFLFSVENSV